MSPAHVLEPTYRRLKRGLMEGVWPQGAKLEALKLADDFGVSMTPVRDSLNRLAGEKLVELHPGEGYRVHRLTERDLRELLEVHAVLLASALRTSGVREPAAEKEHPGVDLADSFAATFAQIASRSGNSTLAEIVNALGDRLHVVRRIEPRVLPHAASELDTIDSLVRAGDPSLSAALRLYHQRRRAHASQLIASLE